MNEFVLQSRSSLGNLHPKGNAMCRNSIATELDALSHDTSNKQLLLATESAENDPAHGATSDCQETFLRLFNCGNLVANNYVAHWPVQSIRAQVSRRYLERPPEIRMSYSLNSWYPPSYIPIILPDIIPL